MSLNKSFPPNNPTVLQSTKIAGNKRKYMSLHSPTLDPISNLNPFDIPSSTEKTDDTPKKFNPVVDMEINNVVSLVSSRPVTPKENKLVEVPPLPPYNSELFESILNAKLDICSQDIDYENKGAQQQLKDLKFKTLNEFTLFFDNSVEVRNMDLKYRQAFFKMIEKNIFRSDPKFPSSLETYNYTLNVLEPSWNHLIFCYQLLLRFLTLFPDSVFFNFNIAKRAIFLMQLPDSNERTQLVSFLKLYYDLRPNEHDAIVIEIRNSFISLCSGQLTPFCMMPLLLTFTHILFRKCNQNQGNIDAESRRTFMEGALPLIGFNFIPNQYQYLKSFFVNSLRIDNNFIYPIIKTIQNKWPRQNGSKIPLMLDLLISIVKLMDLKEFSRIAINYFDFLAYQLSFGHYKTIDTIIPIWTKEDYKSWITANSTIAIDKMYEVMSNISLNHWDDTIKKRFENVLKIMSEINPPEFHKMRMITKRKHTVVFDTNQNDNPDVSEKWKMLAEISGKNEQEKKEKEKEIDIYFQKHKSGEDKKFLPRGFNGRNHHHLHNSMYRTGSLAIKSNCIGKIVQPRKRYMNSSFCSHKLPAVSMVII